MVRWCIASPHRVQDNLLNGASGDCGWIAVPHATQKDASPGKRQKQEGQMSPQPMSIEVKREPQYSQKEAFSLRVAPQRLQWTTRTGVSRATGATTFAPHEHFTFAPDGQDVTSSCLRHEVHVVRSRIEAASPSCLLAGIWHRRHKMG